MTLPLTIPLRPSSSVLAVLALAHLLVLLALFPLALPLSVRLALAVAVLASAILAFRRIRRSPFAALRLGGGGELELVDKVGAGETATVLPATTMLPNLIVLLLRCGQRTIALVLPPDATGRDMHRQLRLWLKWRQTRG